MIIVEIIKDEKGANRPKEIPIPNFGSWSDDNYFYFFESKEEYNTYYNNIRAQFPPDESI